jgi:hypothetical protein
VSEAPVSPKVTVSDAEPESNDVNVGYDRTYGSYDPNALWNAGLVKERPDSKGGNGV